MSMKTLMAIGFACVALALSGCGSDSNAASGDGGKPTLVITAPGNGANVQARVTLKFTPSKGIGAADSGKDHVHVIIDGKTDDYTLVTSTTYEIKSLPTGQHLIGVTLQHADHSPAGGSGGTGDGSGGYGY